MHASDDGFPEMGAVLAIALILGFLLSLGSC